MSWRLIDFWRHDLGVIPGVGRVGHAAGDLQQHLVAANQLELIAERQLIGQRDGVNGFPLAVQVADRPIDDLVSVTVEVLGGEELGDLVEDVVIEQDSAQHGTLGLEVLGRQVITQRASTGLRERHISTTATFAVARTMRGK